MTVSSTSSGNIICPLDDLPWVAIDEIDAYRTFDNTFDALLLPPPTIVFNTFDDHMADDEFDSFRRVLCIFVEI